MALKTPEVWDRFNVANVGLSAVTGTSGLVAVSEGVAAPDGTTFRPASPDVSFFLVADKPPERPVRVGLRQFLSAVVEEDRSAAELRPLEILQSFTGEHVVTQQTIRGAEVVGARLEMHSQKGSPYCVTGTPLGDLPSRDPGEFPATEDKDAAREARRFLGVDEDYQVAVDRVVFPLEEGGVWAFVVRAVLLEPVADVRIYFKAQDLSVLVSHNVASAVGMEEEASLTGAGLAYPVNPLRTPQLTEVTLEGIGPVPPDHLAGPWAKVEPRVPPPVAKTDRMFLLEEADPGFDEVQAFYHLGKALAHFQGLMPDGAMFRNAPFAPMTAIVRDPASPDNAYYLPDTGELIFGDFAGTRPSARSAEIVFHELGHAVSDAVSRLGRGFIPHSQARGMSEGYSDYFACSALNDPRVGDYVADRAEGARNCSRPGLQFPSAYVGEEHATGEVWAAVLWDVRSACGEDIADRIAVESLHFVNRNSSFRDGLAALKTVATRLYPPGATEFELETQIDAAFDAHRPS